MGQVEDQILTEIGQASLYRDYVQRMVETQEHAATISLVDDLEEQDLLEQLLDEAKPFYAENTQERHYLLKTPFRYPPLPYGSRFGTISMPSYFYASETIETLLAECAYYRFVFFYDLEEAYTGRVNSEHMSFSAKIDTNTCFDLTSIDNQDIQSVLKHASHYQLTQTLGKRLLEKGAGVIRYFSARFNQGVNVAISSIECIKSRTPERQVRWQFQTNMKQVAMRNETGDVFKFSVEDFMLNGVLPRPA